MDGIGRACLECQAPLRPDARFCPRCGQPTGFAEPGRPVPGGPVPGGPLPGGPDAPGPGFGDGPGFTVMTPPTPAPPAGWGAPAAADWGEPTVTQVPYYPSQPVVPPSAPPQDSPYVPPGYHRPSYGQPPQDPPGFAPFQAYQPPVPGDRQPLLGLPSEPFQGSPPRQPPRRHDRDGSGTPLAVWVILLVILFGGGAAAGVLIAHPFSHPALRATASSGGTPTASTTHASPAGSAATTQAASPTVTMSAAAVTEQEAATNVAAMLSQSVSDRTAINNAYNSVLACDSQMASAPQVFDNAASSRQKLLASLATMSGRAELPAALLSDLTQAWQASIAADQAFAQWATDENAGCTPDDTGSAAYKATITPDNNATKYKTAFVDQWNPIAAQYNLTQYQQNQL